MILTFIWSPAVPRTTRMVYWQSRNSQHQCLASDVNYSLICHETIAADARRVCGAVVTGLGLLHIGWSAGLRA